MPSSPTVNVSALNEGRGDDPGDACLADGDRTSRRPALNEGRGDDPGDASGGRSVGQLPERSTKAGVMTPAMPVRYLDVLRHVERSTKAGVMTPAMPYRSRLADAIVPQRRPRWDTHAALRLLLCSSGKVLPRITGGSGAWPHHPWPSPFVFGLTAQGGPGGGERPIETVDVDPVAARVDDRSQAHLQTRNGRRAEPALEDRILDTDAESLAYPRDLDQATLPFGCRRVDVVGHDNIHQLTMTYGGYAGRSPRRYRAKSVAWTTGSEARGRLRPSNRCGTSADLNCSYASKNFARPSSVR